MFSPDALNNFVNKFASDDKIEFPPIRQVNKTHKILKKLLKMLLIK